MQVSARCFELAASLGLRRITAEERGAEDVPFDVFPVLLPGQPKRQQQQQGKTDREGEGEASTSGSSSGGGSRDLAGDLRSAEAAVEAQGRLVRDLKEGGRSNQDSEVQAGVQVRRVNRQGTVKARSNQRECCC
jgi:hypothetical protein